MTAGNSPWWFTESGAVVRRPPRECGQRHHLAAGRSHEQIVERRRALPEAGRRLHHDVILVLPPVHRRDLTLAERVVERRVDQLRGDAVAGGLDAVVGDQRLQAAILLVAVDVGDRRHVLEAAQHQRRELREVGQVVALHRELILRVGLAAADPHVLRRLQIQRGARHRRQLRPQARDDLIGRHLALVERLERDEQARGVGRAASAGEADHVVDRRIGLDDVDHRRAACRSSSEKRCPDRPGSIRPARPVSCCGKNPFGTRMNR